MAPRLFTNDRTDPDQLADLNGSTRHLSHSVAVLRQLCPLPEDDAEVNSDASTLAHIAEAMATAPPPRLIKAIECGPIDGESVTAVTAVAGAVRWAAGTAAELHEVALADRKAEAAVA